MKQSRAGVQRVDHHLAIDRPGDFHAPVLQVRRDRIDLPIPSRIAFCSGEKIRHLALINAALPFRPLRQQLQPARVKLPL